MPEPAHARRLLAGCDEQQIAAITSEAAPLLIVAGAGSGKTRVLTRRIAWCTASGIVTPAHVLALTFTRKAAGELRERLASLGLAAPVTAGTFHAVALAQLRRRALDLGRPLPVIVESKVRILADLVPKRIETSRSTTRQMDRREALGLLASEIEWAKARMVAPAHFATEAAQCGRDGPFDPEFVEMVYAAYEREMRRRRVLDFDDLLLRLIEAIENDPELAATQRWRFQYLFVDELQDANTAQLRLLDAWVGGRPQLCAVGDPRQAIYGWNGADASAVLTFTERHPGAVVLQLDANYRSSPQVVAVAATALGQGTSGPVATRPDGPVPSLVAYPNDAAEVAGVIAGIRRSHGPGRRWSDCAVLARTNSQLASFADALGAALIPCRTGGTRTFLQRPAVKRALDGLHALASAAAFATWLAGCAEEREGLTSADLEDLVALSSVAREYLDLDSAPSGTGFRLFLHDALRADSAPGRTDAVQLMTFHRAKGLEFPVVFVTGLEDGFVPIAHAQTRAARDEERRLLYVAMSRAEGELHCSWARVRRFATRTVERTPSPYLAPIESACALLEREKRPTAEIARQALMESRAVLGRPADH